jgi:regulator of cell morphogenesis and NO signaling
LALRLLRQIRMNTLPAQSNAANDVSLPGQADSLASIVDFILRRFHEPLRRDLPGLVERARQIEAPAATSELIPVGITVHLEQIRLAVESHLAKEEQILFPLILAGRGRNALMPIRVMMTEHDDHTQNLRRTRELTHDFALPDDASAEWRELYQDLRRLEDELGQHIELENKVLFARALEGER